MHNTSLIDFINTIDLKWYILLILIIPKYSAYFNHSKINISRKSHIKQNKQNVCMIITLLQK